MYSVRINTLGGIQKATFSSLVGCTINRFYDNDSIRLRTKLDGSIKFYSSTYSLLQQLRDNEMLQTDIYIDLNDVEIYSGKLQMQGEWNEYKQECSLPVEIYDEYTVLLRDIDRTFGFRNTTENTYSQVKTERDFSYRQLQTQDLMVYLMILKLLIVGIVLMLLMLMYITKINFTEQQGCLEMIVN